MSKFDYYIAYDPDGKEVAEGENLGAVEAQAKDYCDKTGKKIIINGYIEQDNNITENGHALKSETLLEGETELLTITPNA